MGRAPCCEKGEVKKGPWSIHEDRILMNYIALHGHPNWRALPKQAGLKRCGKSCRLRWFNYLKPDIKRGNFTKEEEDAIINLHQLLGNKWSAIAARLPGRTDNEIKNVWHTHLKKRLIINSSKDDHDDNGDDDHKEQQRQQPPAPSTETYASSSPDSGSADQASSSSSSSKYTVDDDFGSTAFPEIDHTFLSQVLSDDDQYSDFMISTTTSDPIFAPAAAQDQYSSSSSSSSDTDDQFWYNLYTAAAAAADGDDHYSLGRNLPDDTVTFDCSLIDLPLNYSLHFWLNSN